MVRRSQYHPVHGLDLDEIELDLPEGEWGVAIPRGKCVVRPTEDSYPCYPMLVVNVRLDRTEEDGEKYENALGIELSVPIIFGGINNRAAREGKIRLKQLCEVAGVDLNLVPKKLTSQAERDLDPLIRALEGTRFTAWTRLATHGDEDIELLFQKPEQARETTPPFIQFTSHAMSRGAEGYTIWALDVDGRLWFRWTGARDDDAGWSLTDHYIEES